MVRACFVALGKTAELEVNSIERALDHLRALLDDWGKQHMEMYDGEEHTIPSSKAIDLAKLASGTLMSDNASAALKTSKLLAAVVCDAVEAAVESGEDDHLPAHVRKAIEDAGDDLMGEDGELDRSKLYELIIPLLLTCARHTANLVIDDGVKAEVEFLKSELAESLGDFTKFERVTAELDDLLRSCAKEFDWRSQATYPKGDSKSYFFEWLRTHHGEGLVLSYFRGMCGSRQDFATDAAAELWWNRPIFLEFLHHISESKPDSSILRTSAETVLGSQEMVGALMARAVLQDKIFEPLRFLCASNDLLTKEQWTSLSMGRAFTCLQRIAERGAEDGRVLFDASLDAFESIGSDVYCEFMATLAGETAMAPDLKTKIPAWRTQYRAELYNPTDETNRAAVATAVKVVEVWCKAILESCEKTAIHHYLEGGQFSAENQTEAMKTAAAGTYRNNDKLTESVFGLVKEIVHRFRGTCITSAAGMASAKKQGVLDDGHPPVLFETRAQRCSGGGGGGGGGGAGGSGGGGAGEGEGGGVAMDTEELLSVFSIYGLPEKELASLVAMVMKRWSHYRDMDRTLEAEQLARNTQRATEAKAKLRRQMENAAYAAYKSRGAQRDSAEVMKQRVKELVAEGKAYVETHATATNTETRARNYLRVQIQIHVKGFGCRSRIAQGQAKATMAELVSYVETLIAELEASEQGEDEVPVLTFFTQRQVKRLGTPTAQAMQRVVELKGLNFDALMEAENEVQCDQEEAAARAAAKAKAGPRKRRVVESKGKAPAMNEALVGKWLRYGFLDEVGNELLSFHGIIKQVASERASFEHLSVTHQVP